MKAVARAKPEVAEVVATTEPAAQGTELPSFLVAGALSLMAMADLLDAELPHAHSGDL
jgi:hypothetical protein